MKKIVSMMLVLIMAFSALGGTIFANAEEINSVELSEEIIITEEDGEMEEEIEEMEGHIEADLSEEEKVEGEYKDYKQLKDEFRILNHERKITRNLLKDMAAKRIKIAALKERARIKGEWGKLEVARLIEKEIRVFNNIIHRIRNEKHELWKEFHAQIQEGKINEAEKTLRKIIVLKKLINENLKHIIRFMSIEIEVLNK